MLCNCKTNEKRGPIQPHLPLLATQSLSRIVPRKHTLQYINKHSPKNPSNLYTKTTQKPQVHGKQRALVIQIWTMILCVVLRHQPQLQNILLRPAVIQNNSKMLNASEKGPSGLLALFKTKHWRWTKTELKPKWIEFGNSNWNKIKQIST